MSFVITETATRQMYEGSQMPTTLKRMMMLAILFSPLGLQAQSAPVNQRQASADGSHDFDFEFGCWNTHIRRLQKPLTGSKTWLDYDGTSAVRKIWGGKANLVELNVEGPAGHIQGLSLRLYSPQSHQWSLYFANSAVGSLGIATVGQFKDGRGEFFDQETFDGRMILVRNVWRDITSTSGTFEQSFSEDGGKSWELNWIATDTLRHRDTPPEGAMACP